MSAGGSSHSGGGGSAGGVQREGVAFQGARKTSAGSSSISEEGKLQCISQLGLSLQVKKCDSLCIYFKFCWTVWKSTKCSQLHGTYGCKSKSAEIGCLAELG